MTTHLMSADTARRTSGLFAAYHTATGEPILIRRGTKGYWPYTSADTVSVRDFNEVRGHTARDVMAAVTASLFGWDVPGAQADAYTEEEAERYIYGTRCGTAPLGWTEVEGGAELLRSEAEAFEPATLDASVQELAADMAAHFEERKRDNGTGYFALIAARPDWMRDVVMEAHAGQLPNDYRYRFILAAVQALEDGTDEEHIDAAIDSATGTYTSQLTDWLASSAERVGYCDEAAADLGLPANLDMWGRIREGQRAEIAEVFAIVRRELEARLPSDSLRSEAESLDRVVPDTLNGHDVVEVRQHPNCCTVMVERGADLPFVVATWWPALGRTWSWGHYCEDRDEANEAFAQAALRNRSR